MVERGRTWWCKVHKMMHAFDLHIKEGTEDGDKKCQMYNCVVVMINMAIGVNRWPVSQQQYNEGVKMLQYGWVIKWYQKNRKWVSLLTIFTFFFLRVIFCSFILSIGSPVHPIWAWWIIMSGFLFQWVQHPLKPMAYHLIYLPTAFCLNLFVQCDHSVYIWS